MGFKARVDFSACTLYCLHATAVFLRFTSDATPAKLLMVTMVVGHIPYIHLAGEDAGVRMGDLLFNITLV